MLSEYISETGGCQVAIPLGALVYNRVSPGFQQEGLLESISMTRTSSTPNSIRFVSVVALFITCLISANIIAVKPITILGLTVPAATIIFPISYICGGVLTEIYGYRRARRVIWLGFACNLLTIIAIWAGQMLPGAAFWDAQTAYERILGLTPRLLFASFCVYLVVAISPQSEIWLHHTA